MKMADVDLSEQSVDRLRSMAAAGAQVLECYRVLQKSDANIVSEVLRGQGDFFEWDHYPNGDVYDWESHSQYYYHAHPPEKRANIWGDEHGHFHTFLRPKGMPKGIEAAPVVDYEAPDDANDALTHFIGISMSRAGFPIRLFATNRWVTGEVWYAAADVITMLDNFDIDQALPSWPVNIWVTALLKLYRPQVEALLVQRDTTVGKWEAAHPGKNAYEDRDLEITSIIDISVEDQINKIEAALAAA